MIYAVIDTNVIVAALLTHNPMVATAKVLDFLSEGRIAPVYNEEIMNEYQDVLHRKKFHFKEDKIQMVLNYIRHYGIHSDRIPYAGNMPDEKDRPFYEVSLKYGRLLSCHRQLEAFPCNSKSCDPISNN